MQDLINKSIDKLYKNLFKIELIALIIVLIGIALKYFEIAAYEYVVYAGLIIPALTYFALGFRNIENKTKWDEFLLKVSSYALVIFAITLMFILNEWPGVTIVIQTPLIGTGIAFIMIIIEIFWVKKSKAVGQKALIRIGTALIISASLYFSPLSQEQPYKKEYKKEHKEILPEADI